MVTRSVSYNLRASTPQPVKGICATGADPTPPTVGFVLQTFKASRQFTDSCEDKAELLCSNDMLGLGGKFVSASYSAQRFPDPETGNIVFQAQETPDSEIIEEDEVPGILNL